MKKLWEKKETATSHLIESFTVGKDRELDLYLAPFDVLGSIAHVKMLAAVKLLTEAECALLVKGLQQIYQEIEAGSFTLSPGVEDVHSQVEMLLTDRLGEVGKKIHMARSRNDQVLVDLRLFLRSEIEGVVTEVRSFFDLLSNPLPNWIPRPIHAKKFNHVTLIFALENIRLSSSIQIIKRLTENSE